MSYSQASERASEHAPAKSGPRLTDVLTFAPGSCSGAFDQSAVGGRTPRLSIDSADMQMQMQYADARGTRRIYKGYDA